ncbi:MAG: hydrocarbon degradation protein [Bacteroidetes bacterium]|jgi:long-chain fatty acid transport protein|nr:hydrocarbon degradation protein [Bacteroidota bacterium]|tara:strand:+ start:1886 stop:3100 length:1215 start_codon:yes stop_codon:yes gene_type:complete
MRKVVLLMLSSVFISMSVFAGGYQVRLQGNKQNGFGLVGTSLNWGSSSIFYNPGALSFMKDKIHFAIGASGIMSNAAFQQSGSSYAAETDNPISTPFYVYGAAKINELITVGVGVYTPFGSSVKWKDDWSGKLLIQNISLKAIFIQPTISFNLNEKFGVGAGFSYTTGSVEINKALNYGPNSDVNLNANANGIGFNLGVFYKASDKLSIGLDYRSKISMKVDGGDATFNVPSSLNTLIPATNKFDTELPLPGNLDFGIAYWVTENLLIAFELDWIMWSTYDSLSFTFYESGALLNSSNTREYRDSFVPRVGIQYNMMDNLQIRAGAYYDSSPANPDYFTPETVSLNTFAYTLGLSYSPIEMLSIDVSFLQLFGQTSRMNYTPENFNGTYQTITYIPGLGVSLKF